MTTLVGIVGSKSQSSKTKTAVEVAVNAVSEDVTTDIVHLAEYDLIPADGRTLEEYDGDTKAVLDTIIESDAFLIGTPIYRASYPGVLKNLFDMIPRGKWQADVAPLTNSAVGLVATGATDHHYLTIDTELRPLLAFFGAHVLGSSVYVRSDHFENGTLVDEEITDRLEGLGQATVELSNAINSSTALRSLEPQV